jgi:hypothetical protein
MKNHTTHPLHGWKYITILCLDDVCKKKRERLCIVRDWRESQSGAWFSSEKNVMCKCLSQLLLLSLTRFLSKSLITYLTCGFSWLLPWERTPCKEGARRPLLLRKLHGIARSSEGPQNGLPPISPNNIMV